MKNLTVLQQLVSKQISVKTLRTPIKSGKCISCLLGDSCLVKEQNMTQPLLKSSDNSTVDSLLIPFHLKTVHESASILLYYIQDMYIHVGINVYTHMQHHMPMHAWIHTRT